MIFGYLTVQDGSRQSSELCIAADKQSYFSQAIRISSLVTSDAGVHFVGTDEAIIVTTESGDKTKIISAVKPSRIYLTPNLNTRPGFAVDKIKVILGDNVAPHCYFDRGKGWEEWRPNVREM